MQTTAWLAQQDEYDYARRRPRGVHHHDGFLNVNGILKVASTSSSLIRPWRKRRAIDVVHEADVTTDRAAEKRYTEDYGDFTPMPCRVPPP